MQPIWIRMSKKLGDYKLTNVSDLAPGPEKPLCSWFNSGLIDITLPSPHSAPCNAVCFARVLKKHNSLHKFVTRYPPPFPSPLLPPPLHNITTNVKVPLFILLTFPSAFRGMDGLWRRRGGFFLCLTMSLNTHTVKWAIILSPPPAIHFLRLAIIGNELTWLPLHPHWVILSFCCTGRSAPPEGGGGGGLCSCYAETNWSTLKQPNVKVWPPPST